MSDGTITIEVELTKEQLKKALNSLDKDFDKLKQNSKNTAAKVSEVFDKVGDTLTKAGTKLAVGITAPLTILTQKAISVGNEFEAQMSKVQAISGATGDELDKLTQKAQELGSKTKFSASESAEAFQYMAMAGWKTEDMLNGIDGIMNLAAASGENLGTVSDIVTDALTAFGLQAKDSAHFADVLAKASSNSNTNVGMMGATFKYVAPIAGSMKYSIEDTAVAIGLMANAGIKGEQAGTALRAMLTRLVKPPKDAATALDKLDISAQNADGTMKPLSNVLKELREKFSKLNDSQKAEYASSIAGTEAMSGMLAIVNASDDDFQKLTESINNANGAAQEQAKIMEDNTKGAITEMNSALEAMFIEIQRSLAPTIKKFANFIKDLANKFSKLNDKQKETIVKVAGIIAIIGPALILIGKVSKGIAATITIVSKLKKAIESLKIAKTVISNFSSGVSSAFSSILGPIGIATAAITTAVVLINNETKKAKEETINNANATIDAIGKGAQAFEEGISSAKSYLDDFDSTLFASSSEQQRLTANMNEVQEGITEICRRAAQERRDYTAKEIKQLDEYFKKLNELKEAELAIQQSIAQAITTQAENKSKIFQGSLEEYEQVSQEWIKTAEEQRDKEIELIKDGTVQQVALLNQRYGDKANIENEAYALELQKLQMQEQQKIEQANSEVGKVYGIFAEGYKERSSISDDFLKKVEENNKKEQECWNAYYWELGRLEEQGLEGSKVYNEKEELLRKTTTKKIEELNRDLLNSLSDEGKRQLGCYLDMVSNTEMYGGKLTDENKEMATNIINALSSMPSESRSTIDNMMSGMLSGMKQKSPSLFAQAKGIADGVIGKLNKIFQIRSPSRVMKKIFGYVVEGGVVGLKDKQNELYSQIDRISKKVIGRFDIDDISTKLQNTVSLETGRISTNLSTTALNNTSFTANINITGNTYMDSEKVGRMTAPAVAKTFRGGGAYAN